MAGVLCDVANIRCWTFDAVEWRHEFRISVSIRVLPTVKGPSVYKSITTITNKYKQTIIITLVAVIGLFWLNFWCFLIGFVWVRVYFNDFNNNLERGMRLISRVLASPFSGNMFNLGVPQPLQYWLWITVNINWGLAVYLSLMLLVNRGKVLA